MSNSSKTYKTYSVFVGRLPPDTKKYELRDLFQGCGEIVDVHIADNDIGCKNYGFVRYVEVSSAFSAVSELDGWTMKGSKLNVQLSNDTAEKLKQETAGRSLTVSDGCEPRKNNPAKPGSGHSLGTDYITDTMYWTRLQESCTALNMKNSSISKHLSMNRLADGIKKTTGNRCDALWGTVNDASTSFSEISSKIMQRCKTREEGDETLGKKNCAEFMSALHTIMKEIDGVIGISSEKHVEEMDAEKLEEIHQLTLEKTLVIDLNNELDKEEGIVGSGGKELKISDESTRPKRLSDVSVQTVNTDDGYDMSSSKLPYNISNVHSRAMDHLSDNETGKAQFPVAAVGCSDREERDLSHVDPAIVDFHLSQFKESEVRQKSRDLEKGRQDDVLREFYSKMELGNHVKDKSLARSNSRDSSLSDGSDDGNIDDSGVESDCFGVSRGRMSFGIVENMLRVKKEDGLSMCDIDNFPRAGCKGRFLCDSVSEPSLRQFNIEQYVLKSRGRGRGMLEAEIPSRGTSREHLLGMADRQANVNHAASSTDRQTVGVGRGLFGNLKFPIGRGHPT